MMDAYLVGLIAVGGTLLGALTAGLFQYLATRRQLQWQAQDTEQRRRADFEQWAHNAIEERQRTLWAERRRVYGALLTASEGWTDGDRQQARERYATCLRDVELLGHESVIPLARALRDALDQGEETAEIKERLVSAMRYFLTRVHLPVQADAAVRKETPTW